MDILSVSIRNFLIIGQADIDLSNRGLCRIAGENSDDTTSSSNGSGKSSLIEGLYWALFGETLRNIKSADGVVNNRSRKDCSVVVCLHEEGTRYRIERYRKHSKHKNNLYLYINDVDSRGKDNKETQQYIESVIGMDKMSFANSVVFGQGHGKNLKRFSEMGDSEKKETLEKILNLRVFAQSHDIVKDHLKEMDMTYALAQRRLEGTLEILEARRIKLSSALERSAQFEESKDQEIEQIGKKIKSIEKAISRIGEDLEKLVPLNVESLEAAVEGCEELLREQLHDKSRLTESFLKHRSDQCAIRDRIKEGVRLAEEKKETLLGADFVGTQCEYCGNMVTDKALFHARDGFEFDAVDLGRSVKTLEEKISSLTARYKERVSSIEEGMAAVEEFRASQRESLKEALAGANVRLELSCKLTTQQELLETCEGTLEKARAMENAWESAVVEYQKEVATLEKEAEELGQELEDLTEKQQYYAFWKEAFSRSGIRSYLLDRIIPFLNDRVGYYLGILTDGGIGAKFSTVKQLSSGEYRDNFNLEISNRYASQTYEGNSGGERRRIDLGVALGFNDFLASRSGKRFNILILDEVFEGVDADGIYYVIKVLEDLSRQKSSVFVITHKDELKGYFPDEILMARKDGLSYVGE